MTYPPPLGPPSQLPPPADPRRRTRRSAHLRRLYLASLATLSLIVSGIAVGASSAVTEAATTALTVVVGDPTGTVAAGQTLTYPVTVTNPGTDAVNDVSVSSDLSGTVDCPTTTLLAGESMQCAITHAPIQSEIDSGTLTLTASATGTAATCTVAPLVADLPKATGSPYTFTGIQENGADIGGFQWTVRYRDGAGNVVGYLRVRFESTGTLADSTLVGSDFNFISESLPGELEPMVMQYVFNTVTNGYFAPNTHTLTGKGNLGTGSIYNNATAFTPGWSNRATGFTVISEDQPDEIINAAPGDSLVAGTRYDLTDTQVYAGEAPQYVLGMNHDAIFSGELAEYRFDQWGGPLRREDHAIGVAMSGCRYTPTSVSGDGSTSISTWNPGITLVKSGPTGSLAAGQTVSYDFDVTNAGNVSLNSIALVDDMTNDEACSATILAPQATMTCRATHVVTQAEVDAGVLTNSATVTGYLPDGATTVSDADTVTATVTAAPALTVTKSATPAGADVGATISYSIVVTNTGNVTLNTITVDDPLTTDESCPTTPIAPGEALTCTATYTITQADADAGTVTNTATASALDPSGTTVTADGTDSYAVNQNGAISVTKTAAPANATVGDTITYTITATNTGNVTLNTVSVDDPLTSDESCPATPIAPGASIECTATYALTQSDVDAGTVSNTATVTALDPAGASVSADGTNAYTPDQTASLSLTKSGTVIDPDGDGTPNAGDTIKYTITVTNTGAVTIDNIAVSDPPGTPNCSATSIGAGKAIVCNVVHTITQAELDAGSVANTASASGTDPTNAAVSASGNTTNNLVQTPALSVTKSPTSQALNTGDTIDYNIVVVNSGNVTIDNLAITDALTADESCPATSLTPGAQMVCTASHVTTQADVDAGTLSNTATVSGTDPNGAPVSDSGVASIPFAAAPSLGVTKEGALIDTNTNGVAEAGETIDYTIIVTNTGNVTASNVTVDDPTAGTPTCDMTELLPGQIATCSVTYVITQADIDAQQVVNTATANAVAPDASPITASDSFTTPIPASTQLLVAKAGVPVDTNANGRLDVGEVIDYTIVVTNTGNVTVSSITVTDPLTGAPDCPFTLLAPGAQGTCTASYTLTQADIDSGSVTNTATVSGLDQMGGAVEGIGSNTNAITAVPSLSATKSAVGRDTNDNGTIEVGEFIDYSIVVTNTGNVSVSTLAVADPIAGTPTCDVATLAAGATATCTVSLSVTQSDIDAGGIDNTATATGVAANGDSVTVQDSTTFALAQTPSLSVNKTGAFVDGNGDSVAQAGETIDFTITVLNNGNVTLTDLAVTDPTAGNPTCSTDTLSPNLVATCTVTYTLTQADIDAGQVANTASATALDPADSPIDGGDATTVTLAAAPQLAVTKTGAWVDADADEMVDAGETIDYTIVITNIGNVTVANLSVTDPTAGNPTCDVATLAPAAVATCAVTYTITEADIVAGSVANTAAASGTDPANQPVTASGGTTTELTAVPRLGVVKMGTYVDVDGDGVEAAGDRIDYVIMVTNTGNVTIAGLAVDDPLTGAPGCDTTTLAPGASANCAVSYTLTVDDVDLGSVVNTATATGSDPTSNPVSAGAMETMPIDHVPSLAVTKSASVDTYTVGSVVTYSIVVRNSGNVTIDQISLVDDLTSDEACPSTVLAPDEQMTCSATYTLTQADLDRGSTPNTATVTGNEPYGQSIGGTDTMTTPFTQSPALTIAKTGTVSDDNVNGRIDVGETVSYVITVENTGNVTVSEVAVSDPKLADLACDVIELTPGMQATCSGTYALTQADLDAGTVANTATVVAKDPSGADVTAEVTANTAVTQAPQLAVAKSGTWIDADGDEMVEAGETIDYTITVTNTGNVTVGGLSASDPLAGTPACDTDTLAPAAVATCTVSYTITEGDIVAGSFTNTATASATAPLGQSTTGSGETTTALPAAPQLSAIKTGAIIDVDGDGVTAAGDRIDYLIAVTNTGNVTIANLAVADPLTGTPACDLLTLAPAASTDCTASYTLTQADIDAGSVPNTATITGTDPTNGAVGTEAATTTPLASAPAITVTKSASVETYTVGSVVSYSIVVRNSGNVTIDNLAILDDLTTDEQCPTTQLRPGEQMTCTATYTLTQSDLDGGSTQNTATVTGTDPSGATVSESGAATTPYEQTPALSIAKTGTVNDDNTNGQFDAGDTVSYTIVVENTGNVTVTAVAVTDPKLADLSCDLTELAPGMQANCTGSYTLTQTDVDAGTVANTASVAAKDPNLDDVTAEVTANTAVAQEPQLDVTKTGSWTDTNGDQMVNAGEPIEYTILVTNTGNVTVTALAVTDPVAGDPTCDVDSLAPGESATCLVTYSITEADIVRGGMTNTASASALAPGGVGVSAIGATTTDLVAVPQISATKSGLVVDVDGDDVTAPGDRIDYTITVSNTGNVTVSSITATDPTAGTPVCAVTELAPGASTDCTIGYTLTQADVDAGSVPNTATISAVEPTGGPVSTQASTTTAITAMPAIEVTKAASPSGFTVGSVVSYSIVVRNTGNVTVRDLAIDDELTVDESCPATLLLPGQQMACTATYALTQSDIDAGTTENTATVTGTDPNAGTVIGSGTAVTPFEQTPGLSMTKTGTVNDDNANGRTDVGDTVSYVIVVTNTGNVTVDTIAVSDPKLPELSCDLATLAPGMQTTCTGAHPVTQADVDSGGVNNHAGVTGQDPNQTQVTADATEQTAIEQQPGIAIQAVGTHADINGDGIFQAGETIEYTATVTNTGNVTLTNLVVGDPAAGTWTCDPTILDPGQSATCTVSYPITQADVDAGRVAVAPTSTATPPADGTVSATDTVTTAVAPAPGLTVLKSADVTNPAVGEKITYTITVANSGNVTITNVVVADDLTPDETCPATAIAPGEAITCTATYTVTQADIDAGALQNTAVATGTTPAGQIVDGVGEVTTPFDQQPAIDAVKTASWNDSDSDDIPHAGETVDYTIAVTNLGNVTVYGVQVDDPTVGPPVCTTTVLAPGQTTDCRVTHTLTVADIDNGSMTNNATANATAPNTASVTSPASVTTPLTAAPGLTLAKEGALDDANGNGAADAGETMDYTITITNTGNVTIDHLMVTDTKVVMPGCDLASLAAGEAITCTVGYVLTQGDIDSGTVSNTATVTGMLRDGTKIDAQGSTDNALTAVPAIDLTMSAEFDPSAGGAVIVTGNEVLFSYVVTNTGNVSVSNLVVTDDLALSITCPSTDLAPTEQMICTARYVLTQADVDAGTIVNGATVVGTGPDEQPVSDPATANLPLTPNPAIEVRKSGKVVDNDTDGVVGVGDAIDFVITITNTGNVTISDLVVDDPLTGAPTCDVASIVPGQVATCAVTYRITQADIDAESVANTASVTGDRLDAPVAGSTEVPLPAAIVDTATGVYDQPVIVDVLANDSDNLDPATLRLLDANGQPVTRLYVAGEGTWTVVDGKLVFTPDPGFTGTTTPVKYTAKTSDGTDVVSEASVTVHGPKPPDTTTTTTMTTRPSTTTSTTPPTATTTATPTTSSPPPGGALPRTGLVGLTGLLAAAALFFAGGALLRLAARRRRIG